MQVQVWRTIFVTADFDIQPTHIANATAQGFCDSFFCSKAGGKVLGFAFDEIDRVSIKKSKAGIGVLVGLGIGVGLAALLVGSVKKDGDNVFAAILVVPLVLAAAVVGGAVIAVLTSTAGGLVGLLVGKKNFRLGKMGPEKKEAALAKLKKYAVFQVLPDEIRSQLVMVE